ncbi:hypothetical protein CFN78_12620 [Amycolatopsis antarctica]|uniref:HTH cro/C1-type domain-containing protein n=1 Tax=Amycolatopsis antarctica TaxID=1854586 RepID=A0A263D3T2_9PSEU|nr:hypothetical protein [Amycolatopsis antarctica]OZM73144.1 hypothetical protein CFN78_12620 [Amycolatopsis antarctica]
MDPDRGERDSAEFPLGAKINHLIGTLYPDRATRPGYARLAAEIREQTGEPMSSTYLWELATGRKSNLTQGTLATLARFFGVPAEYFLDDDVTTRVNAQLDLALALRNEKVRSIALRAEGLSDDTLSAILAMLAEARKIERLAPLEEGAADEPGAGPVPGSR